MPEITHRVYLNVAIIDGRHLGGVVIGLYGKVVPRTIGEKGKNSIAKKLYYKGTPFHRIVSGFMIRGGDIIHGDGKVYESVYGRTFKDENFKIKKFPCRLDGEHVVFGRVIQGMDTVFAMEGGAGTYSGKPRKSKVLFGRPLHKKLIDLSLSRKKISPYVVCDRFMFCTCETYDDKQNLNGDNGSFLWSSEETKRVDGIGCGSDQLLLS